VRRELAALEEPKMREANERRGDIRSPKLLDWFVVNVVKPGRHAEHLRLAWKDGDGVLGEPGGA
jgi:hypothetical protein